jgi:hypothetical protein
MKFEFMPVESLPQLSWFARLVTGSETVVVHHGSMVETSEESFFEGAWDGPFEDRQFHRAATFVGSGGILTEKGLLFASSTNLAERLYSVRLDHCLCVSNSHVFLLAQLDDEPDPTIADYYFDFLESFRRGPASKPQSIKTRQGRRIQLHPYCNLLIRKNLALEYCPKRGHEAPRNYAEYHRLLGDTLECVIANAAHPDRLHSYQPVTAISEGYDSVAIAALAVQAGCRRAVTFTSLEDARAIGKALDLVTKEYDLTAYQRLPDYPEAEFCALPFGSFASYGIMEPELKGKMLLTGCLGDRIWSLRQHILSNLRQPWHRYISLNTLTEFRLRVGFFQFPLPFVGAVNAREIYQISRSDELRPWSVGGEYDRPIPRRIAEDAGVPRHLFGRKKVAGSAAYPFNPSAGLSEKSQNDFIEYCKNSSIRFSNLRPGLAKRMLAFIHARFCNLLERLPCPVIPLIVPLTRLRFRNYNDPFSRKRHLYTFHWGVSKIRRRYMIPEDIRPQ